MVIKIEITLDIYFHKQCQVRKLNDIHLWLCLLNIKFPTLAIDPMCSGNIESSGSNSIALMRLGQIYVHMSDTYFSPLILAHSNKKGKLSAADVLTSDQEVKDKLNEVLNIKRYQSISFSVEGI